VARPSGTGPNVRYELTKLGNELMPTFKKLLIWGKKLAASA
jgi:DNA-binding HxlR family transcriptional regulator